MSFWSKKDLEDILEYAKKVRDDPKTDPCYAKMLDRWINRDEDALSEQGAMGLASIVNELNNN